MTLLGVEGRWKMMERIGVDEGTTFLTVGFELVMWKMKCFLGC